MKVFTLKSFHYFIIAVLTAANVAVAYALPNSDSLGAVSSNLTQGFGNVGQVMMSLSLILGFAFTLGAILKYKNYRDNPSQVPIGTPIFLLLIALAFLFLPLIFYATGHSIFGVSNVSGASLS